MSALFGPGGIPDNFPFKAAEDMPKWLRELHLDCLEYECGRGVRVSEKTAKALGEAAETEGITMSLHAPYFINPANPDPEAVAKNTGYVLASCQAARWMGANRVVIHTGALMGRSREEAIDIACQVFPVYLKAAEDQGFGDILLCPETMGKINQLGDLDEVLRICTLSDRLLPCIDFGHLYARTLGADDGAEAMEHILDRMEAELGAERASRFHSHFSHVEYTLKGGEKRHRTFADSDGFGPDWTPLAAAIARRGWSPMFICESDGTQAEDAAAMKDIYLRALAGAEQ